MFLIKVLDLFCGAGGFSKGFESAGNDIKYGIDIWDACKETFEANHEGSEFICGNITELDPRDYDDVDIVIGSPPCQNFSAAKSKRSKDIDKGMELVTTFLHWVDVIRPKWWVMENVEGAMWWIKRKKTIPVPKIEILNSANYGVPQKRFRCFAGNYIVPKPTHSAVRQYSIGSYFTQSEKNVLKKWKTVRSAIGDIMLMDSDNPLPNHGVTEWLSVDQITNVKYMNIHKALELDEPSKTILTDGGKNLKHAHIRIEMNGKYRALTVREEARLQGFEDDFVFKSSKTNNYTMVGNAVPPPIAESIASAIKKWLINK